MKWFQIDKASAVQPSTGNYKLWKRDLRSEGRRQCVYCAIKESTFGGYRNFHVEHYRPKSVFLNLTNDYRNLFYCCGICNSFKGSDWPGEPNSALSTLSYPNPSVVDYSDVLILGGDFNISSTSMAGKYIVERLYLNRPQLILARRVAFMREELVALSVRVRDLVKYAPEEVAGLLFEVIELMERLAVVAPYEPEDIERA